MEVPVNSTIEIKGKKVGKMHPPYIVAEMSGNHNGSLSTAIEIIKQAKASGADAVKIQTYTPDTITINHDGPDFVVNKGLWGGRKLYELYKEAHTPWEWHKDLFDYSRKIGITLFSSPFDKTAIEFLEKLNNPVYKIASPELIDLELIKEVAKTNKPIILSTGMATYVEIQEAINTAREEGCNQIIVLHCTSAYPAPIEEANLSTIQEIKRNFNVISGLSDHTQGTIVSKVATALGASLIEKHFTLDRSTGGVDSKFSIEPYELRELVDHTSLVYKSIGRPAFKPTESESTSLRNRRSLYITKSVKKGEVIKSENIRSIRPGNGALPKFINEIIGNAASRDLDFGEPFEFNMITKEIKQSEK